MMKILNFGSCNIDHVYRMDHIVVPGETQPSKALDTFPGGKGLNQSVALARAGANVWHAGAIGADGDMLRNVLMHDGVDVTLLSVSKDRTGHAIIQLSDEGQNSILLYGGANRTLTEAYVDDVLSRFDKGDILLLQNETNLVPYIIEKAHARGMQILFNPAPFTKELAQLDYRKITYLVLNEIEAGGLGGAHTPAENLRSIKERYPALKIVLTLGSNGCMYSDAEQTVSHPSFVVDVVDTTAAGDTFIGFFLASIAQENAPATAIRRASAASALAVSRMGAAPSIPFVTEVEEALTYLKPAAPRREERLQKQIRAYIEQHLQTACLSELASELGYAETYAGELLRRVMGVSFSALLQQTRCEVAAAMIRETDLSITEIIQRVGYRNESFFRTLFKEQYGTSPYQYRKRGRGTV